MKDLGTAESIDLNKSSKLTIEKLRNNSDFYLTKLYDIAGILWNLKWLHLEFISSKSIVKSPK